MSGTSVYAVSVDSRSRNPDEPDNSYSIQLQRTMDRVQSVQLGSFQFQDSRNGFTTSSVLNYSEPITIPPNTFLRFQETTTVKNKQTQNVTTSTRTLSMTLPPTLNQITSMNDGTLEATTLNDHGLLFGVLFYPQVGLRLRLVGGQFPQDLHTFVTPSFPTNSQSPVLTTATVDSPYFTGNSQTFTWTTDYLDEITGSVGSPELRMLDTTGSPDNYHSYIHAPKPTWVELFIMLNAAANHMANRTDLSGTVVSATAATPIVVTTTSAHQLSSGDQVVISDVVGNDAANGTFFITVLTSTTFELDSSVGVGAGAGGSWFSPQRLNSMVTFGFDNETTQVAVSAPTRVHDSISSVTTTKVSLVGSLASLLGWGDTRLDPVATLTPASPLIRTVNLKPGLFSRNLVPRMVNFRYNPGDFRVDEAPRTLHYTLPSGTPGTLVIDYGRYSGTQLAEWLTAKLSPLPSQITVTYDLTARTFTFTHNLGLDFALDFTPQRHIAEKFGFNREMYADSPSFTSVFPAMFGVDESDVLPINTYTTTNDLESKKYTFHTDPATRFYTISGTSTLQTGSVWTPLVNNAENFSHNYQVGDILTAKRPTLSGTQGGTKAITDASNTTPIVITTSAAHGLTTGDNVTVELVGGDNTNANGTFFVTVTGATTFELDGSVGSGSYEAGTGQWWTNVSFVTGAQRPSAIYDVVVKSVWDASTGLPLLTLEPTASVFSAEDAGVANRDPLGTPADTDGMIIMQHARRNVFMLHIKHPGGDPDTFGFPSVAWPPSNKTIIDGGSGFADLSTQPQYDPSILGIPVAGAYTSPGAWNLGAPDYMLVVLKTNCTSQDIHTHTFRGDSYPIFAKLLIDAPFVNVSEELHFTTFSGHAKFNSLDIEFRNPDGTLAQFNGRPHNYTLLFTVAEDSAVLPCL